MSFLKLGPKLSQSGPFTEPPLTEIEQGCEMCRTFSHFQIFGIKDYNFRKKTCDVNVHVFSFVIEHSFVILRHNLGEHYYCNLFVVHRGKLIDLK